MSHWMICVSGFSGVGKDEFTKRLVQHHGAIHTGLADPAKRHMADLYGFTYEQLFGPSEFRNTGDVRYRKKLFYEYNLRPHVMTPSGIDGLIGHFQAGKNYWWCEGRGLEGMTEIPGADPARPLWPAAPYMPLKLGQARYFVVEGHPTFWLSPREALQKYCEVMNDLYGDTWIHHGITTHKKLAQIKSAQSIHPLGSGLAPNPHVLMKYEYDRMIGVRETDMDHWRPYDGHIVSCFSDFRHKHEIRLVRLSGDDNTVPVVIRIRHPRITSPPYNHRSEVEQASIPDSVFDFVVDNSGSIKDLHAQADNIIKYLKDHGSFWEPKKDLP